MGYKYSGSDSSQLINLLYDSNSTMVVIDFLIDCVTLSFSSTNLKSLIYLKLVLTLM